MFLLEYVLLLTAALCCTAAPAPDGSCSMPPRLTEAELQGDWDADSYPPGTQANYLCRPGYARLGSIKKVCSKSEWLTSSNGQCKKKSCGHPGDINNGKYVFLKDENFDFGSVIQYSCEEGYRMESKETTRQCTATGWSNTKPECEVVKCPPVPAASNVNVLSTAFDEDYSFGQVVRFQCKDANLKLNGPSEIFCTSTGKWNLDPPTCAEITCKLPRIDKGIINDKRNVYRNTETLYFTCEEGYQATRNGEATCTKDDWNPTPSCSEITCSPYDPIANGRLVQQKTVYKFGEEIVVECNEGYVLQTDPNKKRKCTPNGWFPPTTCVRNLCNKPVIENGELAWTLFPVRFPIKTGDYISYKCNKGYTPATNIYIYCTKRGWEFEPKCARICLYQNARLENAYILNPKSTYMEGEKVPFRCNDDYHTSDGAGDGEITCLPNAEFTEAKCYRTCQAPRLQYGKFSPNKSEFQIGEYLQYTCNKGYMTEGRSLLGSAQCGSTGWSHIPRCISITCGDYRDKTIVTYKCDKGQKPEYDIGQCFYYGMGPPLNCQDIKVESTGCTIPDHLNLVPNPNGPSFRLNAEVYFSCKKGFVRYGAVNSYCRETGWNPPLPYCSAKSTTTPEKNVEHPSEPDATAPPSKDTTETRKKCPLAYSPRNAEIIDPKAAYYSNDKVTMKCATGYKIYGPATIQCKEGIWEQPLECIETTSCRNPPATIRNGYITESSKQAYVADDVVQYGCNSGYQIIGSDKSTCLNSGQWSPLPICTEKSCGEPPNINYGTKTTSKKTFSHGERARYTCDGRYGFSGSDSASCIKGVWSNVPTCVLTACAPPPNVPNTKFSEPESYYKSGETFTYECVSGYSLEGSGDALCKNTQWVDLPVCRITGEQCGPPPYVPSGDIEQTRKPNYKSGEFVTYRCPSYYVLKGMKTVKCTNGIWSDAPVCLEPCTASEKEMKQNNIQFKWSGEKKIYSEHGDTLEFKCIDGYDTPYPVQMRITCNEGKLEYPKCFKSGFCLLQQATLTTNNILYNTSSIVDNGKTILFQCIEGMNPEDILEAKCEKGNINYPRCTVAKSCKSPKIIKNGFLKSGQKTSYDSDTSVEFDCNEDYVIKGSRNVKCENGQWGDLPVCQGPCKLSSDELDKNNIQVLGDPNNLNTNYRHGKELPVTCKSGYYRPIQTSMWIVCDDGKFSYTRCFSGSTCRIDQNEIDVRELELDESHNNEAFYAEGEEIKFKCKAGSRFSGERTGKCSNKVLEYPDCRVRSEV